MSRKAMAHKNRYSTREKKKIFNGRFVWLHVGGLGMPHVTARVDVYHDVVRVSRDTPDALSIAGMFGTAKLWKTCLFTLMENSLWDDEVQPGSERTSP